MKKQYAFKNILRRFSPQQRARNKVLRSFSKSIGLVYFGMAHQHDDEFEIIRGFTASLTHRDTNYAVGTYNGHNVRMVDRYDITRIAGNSKYEQLWTILEIDLETKGLPHVHFVPTGREGGEYGRFYATHTHMQPLNSMLFANHSPELHGRYQIIASPAQAQLVESIFLSPVIAELALRFWPHGIEIERNKLVIYITEHRPTKAVLESALTSALWLADTLYEAIEAEKIRTSSYEL